MEDLERREASFLRSENARYDRTSGLSREQKNERAQDYKPRWGGKTRKSKTCKSKTCKSKTRKSKTRKSKTRKSKTRK